MRYLHRGAEEFAVADAEIILAGGAIGSPQLLMLSGVGPADHLREHNIPVMADSPGVGANLSDHPVVPAMWSTPRTRGLWEKSGPRNLARWQLTHAGPLATNVAEAGGFTRTDPALPAPDIQWHVLPVPYQNFGLTDPSFRALSVLITLVAPGSRGRVQLRSADPRHKALIDPAYLSDISDLDPLLRAIGLAREFAAARPMAKVCSGSWPRARTCARGRAVGVDPPGDHHAVPPGRHLRHGRGLAAGGQQADQRGRHRAAGARDRRGCGWWTPR